jgi:hypothetical protein
MAPLTARYAKKGPIPGAGTWFVSQDEAMTHSGVLIELQVSAAKTLYGVYPTQAEFCSHATNFVKRNPYGFSVAQLKRLVYLHTELSRALVKTMGLIEDARWFANELGALTLFSLKDHAHFVRIVAENGSDSILTLYGVFDTYEQWADTSASLSGNFVGAVSPPFETPTLEYDQCRCTLLRARGALIRPPKLNQMTENEMLPYVNRLPPTPFWFRTDEDALDMAGFTVKFCLTDAPETTMYGVYACAVDFEKGLDVYSKRKSAEDPADPPLSWAVIQDPDTY